MEKMSQDIVWLKHSQVMEYDWGSSDPNCIINQLRKQQHKRCAELWMGVHPKAPSKLSNQQTLSDYLSKNGRSELPFLFKVLCVQSALSIQLHPNKLQAQKLHAEQPNIYPDNNEKPQLFFTLSEFECLLGFINLEDLKKLFTIQPFSSFKSKKSNSIKEIIVQLLSFSQQQRKQQIHQALKTVGTIFPERIIYLHKLQKEFPYDVGILVSCLMKYKVFPPGLCLGLAPGLPHAYLKGDLLQLMKNSDNTVRLGLTPKPKDVKTMLEIMNDKIDLDAQQVQNTPQGYIWNNLAFNSVEVQNESEDIHIAHISIGIVISGVFECEKFNIKIEKGQIIYIQPGNYKVKGPFVAYFGGYSVK